ncbi:hypothetical protein [Tamlana crocina]|uniref:Uncharacterized protein n=1 Tax=Tamlana crocina TaxID=393006 RepID=A0ABX1DDG5_9FLAO|nr:hypothetical protein [Tamlana crocina]NJX15382.1 hypothetical protein [Tamlana crocina]
MKKIVMLSGLFALCFFSASFVTSDGINDMYITNSDQEGLVVYASYDGKEDYGYSFVTKGKDGMEYTLTFQRVEESVLKAFDLNSEKLVGTKFKITFNKTIKVTKDEHGNDDEEEINTITLLEKV